MSLQELAAAISQLPADELSIFARWFEEYLADAWDRRIEEDIKAGRLDEAGIPRGRKWHRAPGVGGDISVRSNAPAGFQTTWPSPKS